jgi:tyrosine-protein kinase Fer
MSIRTPLTFKPYVFRKLHLTHNEYILLLCEASEFERDMRTILLPGLLEHQQAIQEDNIEKWKIVLQEMQKFSNTTTDHKWQELQVRVFLNVYVCMSCP